MKYFYFTMSFMLYPSLVVAESFNFGFYPGAASYEVKTPVGKTEAETIFQPIDLFAIYNLSRDSRVWGEVESAEVDFKASTNGLGGNFESTALNFQYQYRYVMSRTFKPWLGAGLVFSQYDFSNIHLVDKHGYLSQKLPEQSENNTGLILSMTLESSFYSNNLIYGIKYKAKLGDGIDFLSFNLGLQF